MTRVIAPDLEMWLTIYLRKVLKAEAVDAEVSNKEPTELRSSPPRPLIIVRDDSGPRISHVTYLRALGVSVLAGTRMNDRPANDLARLVIAILTDDAIAQAPGSPIAAVEWAGCRGPYRVVEKIDVARRYSTIEYTVIGAW